MTFKLKIECDNAAFSGDDCSFEVARILREAAKQVETEGLGMPVAESLRDYNGNTVGTWRFEH